MDKTFKLTAKNISEPKAYGNDLIGHTSVMVGTFMLFSLVVPNTVNDPIPSAKTTKSYVMESCSIDNKEKLIGKFQARINELSMLRDNWDYEGAKPIHATVCRQAKALVVRLSENILKSLVVFPDVDGTLLFDVRSNNSHSTIFVCDNFFSYIVKKKSGNNEVASGCSWDNDSDVKAMISKIEDSLS